MRITINNKDVTDYVSSVKWGGSKNSGARDCEIRIPKKSNFATFMNGQLVKLYDTSNRIVFQGVIFFKATKNDETEYKAYDALFNVVRSKVMLSIDNMTPEAATRKILKDLNLQVGSIVSTNKKFSKTYQGSGAYEVIMSLYKSAADTTKKQYMLQAAGAKINVVDITKPYVCKQELNSYTNIIDSTYTLNAQNTTNKVVFVDDDGKVVGTTNSPSAIKMYGTLQKIVRSDATQAEKNFDVQEKQITLQLRGNFEYQTARKIKLYDVFTGLSGYFYIDSDSHTFEGGDYRTDLVVTFEQLMPDANASLGERAPRFDDVKEQPKLELNRDVELSAPGDALLDTGYGNAIINMAIRYKGTKYVFGGKSLTKGIDCSNFTHQIMQKTIDPKMTYRTAYNQYTHCANKGKVWYKGGDWKLDSIPVGSLIFFEGTYNSGNRPNVSHVGFWMGKLEGKKYQYIGAQSSSGVAIETVDWSGKPSYWREHFYAFGQTEAMQEYAANKSNNTGDKTATTVKKNSFFGSVLSQRETSEWRFNKVNPWIHSRDSGFDNFGLCQYNRGSLTEYKKYIAKYYSRIAYYVNNPYDPRYQRPKNNLESWKSVPSNLRGMFIESQIVHAWKAYGIPVCTAMLSEYGINLKSAPWAIRELVLSVAVNSGAGGAKSIFRSALSIYRQSGGKMTGVTNSNWKKINEYVCSARISRYPHIADHYRADRDMVKDYLEDGYKPEVTFNQ